MKSVKLHYTTRDTKSETIEIILLGNAFHIGTILTKRIEMVIHFQTVVAVVELRSMRKK